MADFFFSSKPKQISESVRIIAEKIFGDLAKQRLVMIGKNEVSRIIFDELQSDQVNEDITISIDDKSLGNSKAYKASKMKEIQVCLKKCDVIINGCTSDKLLIQKLDILGALKDRKQKPILLIDTNIPGNIDSDIAKIDNCFLYDLNDLEQFFNDLNFDNNSLEPNLEIDDYNDQLDFLIPEVSKKINFHTSQSYLFEEKIRFFLKTNPNITENVGILNFLRFFIKK